MEALERPKTTYGDNGRIQVACYEPWVEYALRHGNETHRDEIDAFLHREMGTTAADDEISSKQSGMSHFTVHVGYALTRLQNADRVVNTQPNRGYWQSAAGHRAEMRGMTDDELLEELDDVVARLKARLRAKS